VRVYPAFLIYMGVFVSDTSGRRAYGNAAWAAVAQALAGRHRRERAGPMMPGWWAVCKRSPTSTVSAGWPDSKLLCWSFLAGGVVARKV